MNLHLSIYSQGGGEGPQRETPQREIPRQRPPGQRPPRQRHHGQKPTGHRPPEGIWDQMGHGTSHTPGTDI